MKEALDKVRAWIEGYDGLPEGYRVDFADVAATCGGIFPQGLEEVERREDIRGVKTVTCRCHFALYRTFYKGEGFEADAQNAGWILEFQRWVQRESILGRAPVLGNHDTASERFWADKGRYEAAKSEGIGLYSVQLHVQFKLRDGV